MSYRWFQVFVGVLAIVAVTGAGCKKKSKHRGGAAEVPKKQSEKLNDQYGKEVVEGDSRVFRGVDKVFWIKANPYSIFVNESVNFEGACGPKNSGVLSWNFGDIASIGQGKTEAQIKGFKASHAYTKIGSYKVIGTCIDGKASQTGTLTIEVKNRTEAGGGGAGGLNPGQNSPSQNSQCGTPPCAVVPGQPGPVQPGTGSFPR